MAAMRFVVAVLALLVPCVAAASVGLAPAHPVVRRALHAASVELEPVGCSGALTEQRDIVVTALHCIDDKNRPIRVRFTEGWTRSARVAATDPVADQAVLVLDEPVPVEPLGIVHRRQIPGTVLYSEGNPKTPRFQSARLDRIGRCDSLPNLPNALFTSIDGKPGDSGAPLVDMAARVVGLVHGGARCHIATPADSLVRLLDRVLEHEGSHLTSAPTGGYPASGVRRMVSGWSKWCTITSNQYLAAIASATRPTISGAGSARTRSNSRPPMRRPTIGLVVLPSMRPAARDPRRT